mgnify:CR=1 FL=1
MTHTKDIRTDENQILFRRFMLIVICITLVGVLFAQLIVATQKTAGSFKVYDRVGAWETSEQVDDCGDKLCALKSVAGVDAKTVA